MPESVLARPFFRVTPKRRVPPLSGTPPGPEVVSLTRDQLRDGLIRRERLEPAPNGTLTGAMRTKLYTMLNTLKDKGKICLGGKLVWLREERQVPFC